MNSLVFAVLAAAALAVFIAVKFALQVRANNRRRQRGELPRQYHDATDQEFVNVTDWSRKR